MEELNEMGDADPSLSGGDVLMVAVIVTITLSHTLSHAQRLVEN